MSVAAVGLCVIHQNLTVMSDINIVISHLRALSLSLSLSLSRIFPTLHLNLNTYTHTHILSDGSVWYKVCRQTCVR